MLSEEEDVRDRYQKLMDQSVSGTEKALRLFYLFQNIKYLGIIIRRTALITANKNYV